MNADVVKVLIDTYLTQWSELLDLSTLKKVDIEAGDKLASELAYEFYEAGYAGDPASLAVFCFVYLESPDDLIPHKLMSLTNEVAWHYSKSDVEALPSIVPVVLYNGEQEWVPKNLKEIYSSNQLIPGFYFEFIDLKRQFNTIV